MKSLYFGNQKNCRKDLVYFLSFPGDSALGVNCQRSYGFCEAEPEPAFTSLHIIVQINTILKNKRVCISSLFLHGHAYSSSNLENSFIAARQHHSRLDVLDISWLRKACSETGQIPKNHVIVVTAPNTLHGGKEIALDTGLLRDTV